MAKKIFAFLGTALVRACVFFTAVSIVLYAGAFAFNGNTDSMTLTRVIFILIFSCIAGIMTAFLTTDVMNLAVRAVLHYVVTLAAFVILFSLVPGSSGGNPVMAGAFFTVLWAIPFAVWLVVRSRRAKKENAGKDYSPSFDGKK